MNRLGKTFALVLAGFVSGGIIAFLSVVLVGGGHGWCSGIWSGLSVLFLPAMGVCFSFADCAFSKYLAAYVSVGCIGLDFALAFATQSEGWSYLGRVWTAVPVFLTLWVLLWLAWHVLLVVLWIRLLQARGFARRLTRQPMEPQDVKLT